MVAVPYHSKRAVTKTASIYSFIHLFTVYVWYVCMHSAMNGCVAARD